MPQPKKFPNPNERTRVTIFYLSRRSRRDHEEHEQFCEENQAMSTPQIHPCDPEEHRFMVSPDWICEILSPDAAQNDRILEMRLFARHPVPYTWLIDPALKTLEVFKLESGRWVLPGVFAKNGKIRAEPFQEMEIDLDNLWLESMP